MKVAYLFSRYPVPSQTFCDTEIRALEAAGLEVEIWSCSAPTTSFRHGVETWPGARVSYAPPPGALADREARARRDGSWPAATISRHEAKYGGRYDPAKRARHALYFAGLLRRQGVEHLHVHFANRATHAALFIHELTGVPFSFTAHAQDFLVDLGSDALLGEMCGKAAFVVAVSEWSRRALVERCPAAASKIRRVYNGLPLDRWPQPDAPPPAHGQPLRIFSVGRLIEFKGFADLIAACAILRDRGVPLRCVIAGEGPLQAALEQQAKGCGDIRLAGLLTQDEIRTELAGCDVFTLACRVDEKEACDVLPTVILEGMAAGRPVVSTRLAAVPEMVDDGKTGLLVPPGDPAALADALGRLAGEPELRATLGAAGRAKVVAQFSANESARQLGRLFADSRFAPEPAPAAEIGSSTLGLCDLDPGEGRLAELRRRLPGARWLSLTTDLVADGIEYLPDPFVLETWWRAFAGDAHRIESARGALGGGCPTDAFLLAARRALYLHHTFGREPTRLRHLHGFGADALLCAWLLVRLGSADTASFFLPARSGLTGATLRRLTPAFAGGWIVGERKLAASLGPGFRSEEPSAAEWVGALEAWGDG